MASVRHEDSPEPIRSAGQGVLIVARDQRDLYDCLQHAYSDSAEFSVLLDRRSADRREIVKPVPTERRSGERRRSRSIAADLRFQQYVLVRARSRRPHD